MGTEKSNELEKQTLSSLLDNIDIEFISKKLGKLDNYKKLPLRADDKDMKND